MMGIDSEALQLLIDTSQQASGAAQKVAVIALPNEPKGYYGIVDADGKFTKVRAEVGPRNHKLLRIDQVPAFTADMEKRLEGAPSVWYSPQGVVVLIDDGLDSDLLSRANLTFKHTEQFEELILCQKSPRWMDPKTFATWIRTKVRNVMRGADDLLTMVSQIKASTGASQSYAGTKSRESIGAEVDSEMESMLGELPDLVLFDVRVYDDPSIVRTVLVTCALECNPRTFEMRLEPQAGQLQAAIDSEMENIGELFGKELKCPLYYGTP